MHIGLLTSLPLTASNKRIVEAAQEGGHTIEVINVTASYIKVTSHHSAVYEESEPRMRFDAIISRLEPAVTSFGATVLHQFENEGICTINGREGVKNARDKFCSLQLLAKHHVPIATTVLTDAIETADHVITTIGKVPLIIKLIKGTDGEGVMLAESYHGAKSVITTFLQLKVPILVQEFIEESSGHDIRCFVIGNKVVAAMERIAQPGEFRANYHLGAEVKPIKITKEERALAIKAAAALRLEIAGVDILRSHRGSIVLEVNASPGLEGIEKATGKNIARLIIEHVAKKATVPVKHYRYLPAEY